MSKRITTAVMVLMMTIVFVAACYAKESEKEIPEESVTEAVVEGLTTPLKQNLAKFFEARNMNSVTFDVELLPEETKVIHAQFVKLTFTDGANTQEQYVFTDGNYVIPDITEAATGLGLKDKLTFKHSTPADLDVSKLSLAYGSKSAKNYIVEVTDFQCPYCRRAHEYLKEKLADKDVAVYLVHFPLSFHPKAELYARVFEAGAKQDISFYEQLYNTMPSFDSKSDTEIIEYFASQTPDSAAFRLAVNDPALSVRVADQMRMAQSMDISGTPAIYFNGRLVSGFNPQMFDIALDTFK